MPPPLPILPDPADPRPARRVTGTDQTGAMLELSVVEERLIRDIDPALIPAEGARHRRKGATDD